MAYSNSSATEPEKLRMEELRLEAQRKRAHVAHTFRTKDVPKRMPSQLFDTPPVRLSSNDPVRQQCASVLGKYDEVVSLIYSTSSVGILPQTPRTVLPPGAAAAEPAFPVPAVPPRPNGLSRAVAKKPVANIFDKFACGEAQADGEVRTDARPGARPDVRAAAVCNDVRAAAVAAAAAADGGAESRPDSRTDSQPDTLTESRMDSCTDSRLDSRTDSRPDSRTDSRLDSRTDSRPDSRTDSRPDSRTDSRPDSRTDSRPDSRTDSRPDSRTDSRPDSRSTSRLADIRPAAAANSHTAVSPKPHKPERPVDQPAGDSRDTVPVLTVRPTGYAKQKPHQDRAGHKGSNTAVDGKTELAPAPPPTMSSSASSSSSPSDSSDDDDSDSSSSRDENDDALGRPCPPAAVSEAERLPDDGAKQPSKWNLQNFISKEKQSLMAAATTTVTAAAVAAVATAGQSRPGDRTESDDGATEGGGGGGGGGGLDIDIYDIIQNSEFFHESSCSPHRQVAALEFSPPPAVASDAAVVPRRRDVVSPVKRDLFNGATPAARDTHRPVVDGSQRAPVKPAPKSTVKSTATAPKPHCDRKSAAAAAKARVDHARRTPAKSPKSCQFLSSDSSDDDDGGGEDDADDSFVDVERLSSPEKLTPVAAGAASRLPPPCSPDRDAPSCLPKPSSAAFSIKHGRSPAARDTGAASSLKRVRQSCSPDHGDRPNASCSVKRESGTHSSPRHNGSVRSDGVACSPKHHHRDTCSSKLDAGSCSPKRSRPGQLPDRDRRPCLAKRDAPLCSPARDGRTKHRRSRSPEHGSAVRALERVGRPFVPNGELCSLGHVSDAAELDIQDVLDAVATSVAPMLSPIHSREAPSPLRTPPRTPPQPPQLEYVDGRPSVMVRLGLQHWQQYLAAQTAARSHATPTCPKAAAAAAAAAASPAKLAAHDAVKPTAAAETFAKNREESHPTKQKHVRLKRHKSDGLAETQKSVECKVVLQDIALRTKGVGASQPGHHRAPESAKERTATATVADNGGVVSKVVGDGAARIKEEPMEMVTDAKETTAKNRNTADEKNTMGSKDTVDAKQVIEKKDTADVKPVIDKKDTENMKPVIEKKDTADVKPVIEKKDTADMKPVIEKKDTADMKPVIDKKDTADMKPVIDKKDMADRKHVFDKKCITEMKNATVEKKESLNTKRTTDKNDVTRAKDAKESRDTKQRKVVDSALSKILGGNRPPPKMTIPKRKPDSSAAAATATTAAATATAGGESARAAMRTENAAKWARSTEHNGTAASGGKLTPEKRLNESLDAEAFVYLNAAKKTKHLADSQSDPLLKGVNYAKACLIYMQSGYATERDSQDATSRIFRLYNDTLNLLQYNPKGGHNAATYKKLAVLRLRMQSMLYLKLYKLKKWDANKLKTIIDEYKSSSKPGVPSPCRATTGGSLNRSTGTPSPMSPQPSPVGSVGSVGSGGSCNGDYKMVNGGGPAGVTPSSTTSSSTSSGGASVSVPLRIHSVTDQYLGLVGYLRHCHESWDQADLLGRDTDDFFRQLEEECGVLTMQSPFADFFRYISNGLRRLHST